MTENAWLPGEDEEESEPGWVSWHPAGDASRPVCADCSCEVKFREDGSDFGDADSYHWNNTGESDDIVAYRVTEWDIDREEVLDNPGFCPVDPGTRVQVLLRAYGDIWQDHNRDIADFYRWEIRGDDSDIMKYRILEAP